MRISKKVKRHKLYKLRWEHNLTQAEFAAKIGASCRCYQNVEWGERDGTAKFWAAVQRTFNIPDAEMYSYTKIDEQVSE